MEFSSGSLVASGIPSNPNEQFFDIPTFARYHPRPAVGNGATLNHQPTLSVMAKKQTLHAEPRLRTGSGVLKQMRREGWLPCVVYGKGVENQNLKVNAKAFRELLAHSTSESFIVNLEVADGSPSLAQLKSVQHDPLSGDPLHVDFLAVDLKSEVTAAIPVHLTGDAPGLKSGGVLEQGHHTLEITCSAANLPETLEFDISHLKVGESLHVGDVKFPEGVRPNYDADVVIAHIGAPRVDEGGAAADAEAEA
jgi:large subunit ribosomal protein L25